MGARRPEGRRSTTGFRPLIYDMGLIIRTLPTSRASWDSKEIPKGKLCAVTESRLGTMAVESPGLL